MVSEEVVLEVEGASIRCQKKDLISNSDYFKAMFEGNFIEKDKNTIHLKDVDLKAMNIILTLIWDDTYFIEDEDVLTVLEASCMLQFGKIRNICLDKIIEILSVKNCLKIWLITEQLDLKSLYLKAKSMALGEFMLIKDSDTILELNFQQLYNYFGNINLRTDNELSVFQAVMKWWYENGESCDNSKNDLLKLLSCIDFKSLTTDHFKEILTYPGVANTEVEDILKCLSNIRNKISTENFSKKCLETAQLLNITRSRLSPGYPCVLVKSNLFESKNGEKGKFIDVYRRKRPYETLDPNKNISFHVVYFDHQTNKFENFFNMKQKLEGFKLVGYKEYVFMYGGEYTLGRGEWNRGFWAYDTVRERWQSKSTLPFPRRHFETCVIESKIFIVGGTGLYRINQENMFWYDYKEDVWSKEKSLPCFDRQIKCCNFLDKFFLFSISNVSGYVLDNFNNWINIPVKIEKSLLGVELGFSIFSYKNKLYIKGKNLVELIMTHNQLLVSSIREITDKDYGKIEATVCNNLVFTLYQYPASDLTTYSLEKYNLDSGEKDFIFENLPENDVLRTKDGTFVINDTLQIFSFPHYTIMEGNELVNTSF